MSRPMIGLNGDAGEQNGSGYLYLRDAYCKAIERAGGMPLVIPVMDDLEILHDTLPDLTGLVLIGGHDLDPRDYGRPLHPSSKLQDRRRELFDRRLLGVASAIRLPVLGIGAGAQLLNVAYGGSLIADIPSERRKAMSHQDAQGGIRHRIYVTTEGSLVDRVYGASPEAIVWSHHHQAIHGVADGFCVTARSHDKIVEAIESTDPNWLAVGVQFHPEQQATRMDDVLFEEFLACAGNHKTSRDLQNEISSCQSANLIAASRS